MSASQIRTAGRRCGLTAEQWGHAVERAVLSSTREQGLPTTLEDEGVLERVAVVFGPLNGGSPGAVA
jgi:hypothetical protein